MIFVINSENKKEPFSYKKVYQSIKRAGASDDLAKEVASIIKKEAYSGIKTSEIYERIKELLQEKSLKVALRYDLKESIRKLGPTGFLFEKYVGEILKKLGYKVKINQYLPGKCINKYEIDFIAQKRNLIFIGECKYRNLFGDRVHSQDALSNYARFLDILNGFYFKSLKYKDFKIKTMMVTNTKFTNQAFDYLKCMKINAIGWRTPSNKGLEYLIEKYKLYPITILPSLKGEIKDIFVSQKIMLVQDVLKINSEKFIKKFNVSRKSFYKLIEEAETLLKP
ncbi:MAG: ATP cone domain-containing protein [Candidatus Pacebacteria bacterium]|nr:ATP cone domain-containing protein [Candidatus Paceibacterota bacterium]